MTEDFRASAARPALPWRRTCRAAPRRDLAGHSRLGAPAWCGRCRACSNGSGWRGSRRYKARARRRTAGNNR